MGVAALDDPFALEQAETCQGGRALVTGDTFFLVEEAGLKHCRELLEQGGGIRRRQAARVMLEEEGERSAAASHNDGTVLQFESLFGEVAGVGLVA